MLRPAPTPEARPTTNLLKQEKNRTATALRVASSTELDTFFHASRRAYLTREWDKDGYTTIVAWATKLPLMSWLPVLRTRYLDAELARSAWPLLAELKKRLWGKRAADTKHTRANEMATQYQGRRRGIRRMRDRYRAG